MTWTLFRVIWDGGLKYVVMAAALYAAFAISKAYYFKQGHDAGASEQAALYKEAVANAKVEQANRVREVLETDARLRAENDDRMAELERLGDDVERLAHQLAKTKAEKATEGAKQWAQAKAEAGKDNATPSCTVTIFPDVFLTKEVTDALRRLQ